MNIFYLHTDPRIAAEYHLDKHVVKMILESAQLLCTAHRLLDGTQYIEQKYVQGSLPARWRKMKRWRLDDHRESILYIAGHINHPSAVWVRANIDHYRWLYDLMYHLIGEYKYRYEGKYHKCEKLLMPLLDAPHNIPIVDWQDPPQAMPDDVKVVGNAVQAYRNYYSVHKRRFATWKVREEPEWWTTK
jgi:predicted DCC family thiol-disulfide oxidoreductase YuxK